MEETGTGMHRVYPANPFPRKRVSNLELGKSGKDSASLTNLELRQFGCGVVA
jgi:hypothetical protein